VGAARGGLERPLKRTEGELKVDGVVWLSRLERIALKNEVNGEGRPYLRACVRYDSKADRFVVETDPGDLLEGVEGCDKFCYEDGRSDPFENQAKTCMFVWSFLTRKCADISEICLESHRASRPVSSWELFREDCVSIKMIKCASKRVKSSELTMGFLFCHCGVALELGVAKAVASFSAKPYQFYDDKLTAPPHDLVKMMDEGITLFWC